MRLRSRSLAALVLVACLVVAACGGDDDDAAPTTTTTAKPTTTTTTTEPAAEVSALTGLPVEDESILTLPVVAAKFDNVQGKSTPQVGIRAADVVYEITVEGQVTRFLALYQSRDAGPLGPIRSARGSEVGLLEELNRPLFTWHGANAKLLSDVRNSSVIPRSIDDIPQLFYRDRSRPAPYNSFVEGTAQIRATAPDDAAGPDQPIITFGEPDEPASPLAVPATFLELRFPPAFSGGAGGSNGTPVRYEWSEDDGVWYRFQAGVPHVDGAGDQLLATNVVVRFVDALDSGTTDQAGSRVPTAQVTGSGEAWVFSRGTVTVGTWNKPDAATPATYLDAEGDEITLAPGTTWIALPYGKGASSFG